jgi:hypothetical protein
VVSENKAWNDRKVGKAILKQRIVKMTKIKCQNVVGIYHDLLMSTWPIILLSWAMFKDFIVLWVWES